MSKDKSNGAFEFSSWVQQGEARLTELDEMITEKQNGITRLQQKIDELELEKVKILEALGRGDELKKSAGHSGKVMIRPILLQKLMENEGTVMSQDALIEAVQAERETAATPSIKTSLQRLVKTHEKVMQTDEGFIYAP